MPRHFRRNLRKQACVVLGTIAFDLYRRVATTGHHLHLFIGIGSRIPKPVARRDLKTIEEIFPPPPRFAPASTEPMHMRAACYLAQPLSLPAPDAADAFGLATETDTEAASGP